MEFRKVLALRGPNIWASYPVLEAWLDLGPYKDCSSEALPGFNERLTRWLPSLIEHRCSLGERGGFLERLKRGTYPAHILEHVCLELQCLAGTEVGFGKARDTSEAGVYTVVVEYEDEQLARAALETARRLVLAALKDEPFDAAVEIEKLGELYRRLAPKPETAALVRAARRRNIPYRFLNNDGLLQLGYGARQHRLHGALTDRTGATGESIARDNHLTRNLLPAVGVPVAPGELAGNWDAAWEAARSLGFPVSIRPRYGSQRRPEWAALQTEEQVRAAYLAASDNDDDPVLVERTLSGAMHQLLVVEESVVAAVRHEGDRRIEVTPRLHPETAARAVEAARVVGLDIAGIEVIAEDITRPMDEQTAAILSVRMRPDLTEFLTPDEGDPQPVAEAIVASLYPSGDNGRIPLVTITGTNGKTTTVRLTAHLLGGMYAPVGMACSEGVYLGDRLIEAGDCSGPKSAQTALAHPRARAAVVETARGGILRAGLGFSRCNVAVVTNIDEGDHLGASGIETPEQLARVKRVIVEAVPSSGAAVLNAADPLVAAMAEHCTGTVIFFARDAAHPVLVEHRSKKGRAVFVRAGQIVLAEGEHEIALVSLDRVPLTHSGRIAFQVENVLASTAAAWSLDVPPEVLRRGLETFAPTLKSSPGRFNLFAIRGATVVLDYGHNPSSLVRLLEALKDMPHQRRSAIYSTAGDRRDCDMVRQGELLGDSFDRVWLFEDHYLRGRQPGEIIALFRKGLTGRRRVTEVHEVQGAVPAMQAALAAVRPGELLMMQADAVDESVAFMRQYLTTDSQAREITFAEAVELAWASTAPEKLAGPVEARRTAGKTVGVR